MEVRGKVAIVTGAAVGVGRAIAERLAAAGCTVVAVDLDDVQGPETVRRIRSAGGQARFHRADLGSGAAVDAMVETTVGWYGGVDVLVNNAGGGAVGGAAYPEAGRGRWTAVLDVNLVAPMRAVQAVLPTMASRGGGVVVNTGSTAGVGLDVHAWPEYAVAKAGLIRLTATLAGLEAECGVRVNCVVPDWVATERASAELAAMDEEAAALAADPPLVPLDDLCEATMRLVVDEELAGRVVLLDRGVPPRLLEREQPPPVGDPLWP